MNYFEILNRVIDDSLSTVHQRFSDQPIQLAGAITGYEECRGKTPLELTLLLGAARKMTFDAAAFPEGSEDYEYAYSREAQVEFVCDTMFDTYGAP